MEGGNMRRHVGKWMVGVGVGCREASCCLKILATIGTPHPVSRHAASHEKPLTLGR